MNRMTEKDRSWGPFTWGPWHHTISLRYSSNGGEDQDTRNSVRLTAFGWALRLWLPRIIRPWKEERESLAYPGETITEYWPREYGFSLSDMGAGYDFLQIHLGAQTHDSSTTKNWSRHLPWMMWDCVRHSMYDPDGRHYFTEPRDKKGRGHWDAWWEARKQRPVCHFLFEDYDGEKIIATCHIEEREWHKGTGWFRWLKWFSKPRIRRDLSLEFSAEVGPEKGSWKGGTTGHGIDMRPEEYPINAFRRYCQMEHERKGRKYRLKFIGPCGPPHPKPQPEEPPTEKIKA